MTLHDEIEIEDFDWNQSLQAFTYQCPCGDLFQITLDELAAGMYTMHASLSQRKLPTMTIFQIPRHPTISRFPASKTIHTTTGEEIAKCPSCSLYVKVIYDLEDFIGAAEGIQIAQEA
jgi:diphthamide biosynthesis protein 3